MGYSEVGQIFLSPYLKKNFKVSIPNLKKEREHPLQKHFRLYDDKTKIPEPKYFNKITYNKFEEFEKSLGLSKKIQGIIIISKDPYSWLLSYEKWANKCAWPSPEYHYIEEYYLFLNKWREFQKQTDKIMFIRYIDLLEKPEKILNQIQVKFELKNKFSIFNTKLTTTQKKVAVSDVFTQKKKDYYTKRQYLGQYSNQSLKSINDILPNELMQFLQYETIYQKND